MDADVVHHAASNIGDIVKARYHEKSIGVRGRGEFYIVIIYVPERTYIFLSLKGLKSPIVKGNEYTRTWLTQDIQKIYK